MDRFFGVALLAAVIYFVGQILLVAVPVSGTGNLQRAIYLLFFIVNLPAFPFRLLFRSASPEVSLAVACFGWGALFYLGGVLRRRLSARRLTSA
ncbi:MAG: hypothetical protein DMD54_03505 [Gemmatimonadetes bacterium]|nr:MAG: hypothetical protein DMD54_03505 [Gemmatimonadota bacterium]